MKIALGYISIFAYVFLLIFGIGELIKRKTNLETSRKTIHSMLFMVWVFIDVFFKNTIHQIIVPIIFLILNALSDKYKIYKSVEREQDDKHGTVVFAIAITIIMTIAYLKKELYLATGVATLCLTIGDGAAALIGYNFESRKIRNNKSLLGTISCFLATFIALVFYRLFRWKDLDFSMILCISAISAIAELVNGGIDNLSVTLSTFTLCVLMNGILVRPDIDFAVMWAVIVFLIITLTKAIDYRGAVLSMLIVFVFRYFAGTTGFGFLMGTYFSIFLIDLFRTMKKMKHNKNRKHQRTLKQIAINGSLGTMFAFLYGLTGSTWLLAVAVTGIGGCFIDSVSSDVGTLSKHDPYDPIHHMHIANGLSGGMSILGTLAAFLFSMLIGIYALFVMKFETTTTILIAIFCFTQTIIDTVLGATLQVKYLCSTCGSVIEKSTHCCLPAKQISGIYWINNNMVNLLSSVIICAVASAVFSCI